MPFEALSAEAAHRRLTRTPNENEDLKDQGIYHRFRTLDWGPTTDSATAFMFREGDLLRITVESRRSALRPAPFDESLGDIAATSISVKEFVRLLDAIVLVLGTAASSPPQSNHPTGSGSFRDDRARDGALQRCPSVLAAPA
ncbi:hypothetical protein ACIOMM_34890 [Streptomyces sp. NPDC087908]|uniref:hypothetical protein n=1 Tax=Streptomyces sp. NPDC087908 TaxID=3365820 RepID=UPI0037FAEFFB